MHFPERRYHGTPAQAVVDPVLTTHHHAHPYQPGTWGPKKADELIAPDGRGHNLALGDAASEQSS
jgi:glucose-6-phosphate 1-dehydrogenase